MVDLYIHQAPTTRRLRLFDYMVLGVLEQSSRSDYPHSLWHDIRESLMSAFRAKSLYDIDKHGSHIR